MACPARWPLGLLAFLLGGANTTFVNPNNATDALIRPPSASGLSEQFQIQNTGSSQRTYSLLCVATGSVTCGTITPSSVIVPANSISGPISVAFSTSATVGPGTLTLQVTSVFPTFEGATGVYQITVGIPITIAPDNGAHADPVIRLPNTTGNTVTFTVTNFGADSTFTGTCTGTGSVTAVTCTPLGALTGGGTPTTVTATFSTTGAGTGSVVLSVTFQGSGTVLATGKWDETVVPAAATASPTPSATALVPPSQTARTQAFQITNGARAKGTYAVAVTGCTGAVSGCVVAPASLLLDSAGVAGASGTATVTYNSGAAGLSGAITVTPSYGGTNLTPGTATIYTANASVTPDGGAVTVFPNVANQTVTFTVTNTQVAGSPAATYSLAMGCTGPGISIPTCVLNRTSLTLAPGAHDTTVATFTSGSSGSGTITVTASNGPAVLDNGTVVVTVSAAAATVDVAPDGGSALVRPPATSSSQTFSVKQVTGPLPATYNVAATCTNPAANNCPPSLSPLTFTALQVPQNVIVNFTSGAAGAASGQVKLTATHSTQPAVKDTGYVDVRVVNATATPVAPSVVVNPNTTGASVSFTVTNTGPVPATFDFTGVCGGTGLSACQASPTQLVNLALQVPTTVNVTFNSGASGAAPFVRLDVRNQGVLLTSATTTVTFATRQAPAVSVARWNPGAIVARDQCVAVALGQGTAAECGDLRIGHMLPGVRTMSKERAPILLYKSDQAEPAPQVAVSVTVPSTAIRPDSIRAILRVGSSVRGQASWPGTQWTVGIPRLVRVRDTTPQAVGTTIVTYTVYVYSVFTTPLDTLSTLAAQAVAVVNRQASPWGRGWWLDGLERLDPVTKLWTGGDGSVRQYAAAGAHWVAPAMVYPDTLKQTSSAPVEYTRFLRAGTKVVFDAVGRHVRTINRVGHTTVFRYAGTSDSLVGIDLPVKTGTRSFSVGYATNQVTVSDPLLRATKVVLAGGVVNRVTSITDPDLKTVSFSYPGAASGLIVGRADRVGAVVQFQLDSLHKVTRSGRHPGGTYATADSVIVSLTPAESRGARFGGSVDTVNATTGIDGPRKDLLDSTVVWVNQFGAPYKIRDALGQITSLTRTDGRFPGAVTGLTTVSGQTLLADYDPRGRLWHLTDQSVTGLPTTFTYDTLFDQLKRIDPPEGDFTIFGVDSTTGDRRSQQDSRTGNPTITFDYDTGLLSQATYPGTAPQKIFYDNVGNADSSLTSLVRKTTYGGKDAAGRPSAVTTDVDAPRDQLSSQAITYNVWNQDSILVAAAKGEQITLTTAHDFEGRPLAATRTFTPNPQSIAALADGWTYDLLGRVASVSKAGGGTEQRRYDPAGNATTITTPRGDLVSMTGYDALNRLLYRSFGTKAGASHTTTLPFWPVAIPYGYTAAGDADTFAYAPGGQVQRASNCDAYVGRAIQASGRIDADTLKIRTATGACGTYGHTYVVGYTYDKDNRRATMTAPAIFPGAATVYGYNAALGGGRLTSITDIGGNLVSFGYKASGELQTVTYPGPVVRTLGYNDDGDLTGDQLVGVAGPFPSLPFASVRSATYTFDARGKLKTGSDLARFLQQDAATYSGLGYLTQSGLHQNWVNGWGRDNVYGVTETFQTDALGNQVAHATVDSVGTSGGWTSTTTGTGPYRYQPATAQLDSLSGHAYQYDAAGNQEWEVGNANFERASYYDIANRLRRTDLRTYSPFANVSGTRTVEDYRYDALGRRVWVWTQTQCKAPSQFRACVRSHVKRTIWDGAALLAEIQAPGDTAQQAKWEQDTGGYNVAYQHVVSPPYNDLDYDPNPYFGQVVYSPGIVDQPLSVTRYSYTDRPISTTSVKTWPTFTYFPHWDRRGVPTLGTFADGKWYKQFTTGAGGGGSCFAPPGSVIDTTGTRCVIMHWPASQSAYDQRHQKTPVETWAWQGSLVEDQRDGSGWSYRRARLFDPQTGRFTQADPIGLAGGLNLYGFANGDPVNFSDPFGLCPPDDTDVQTCSSVEYWRARASTGSLAGRIGNTIMAGFAAIGEDILASAQGYDVGECGGRYACGVPPAGAGGFANKRVLSGLKIAGRVIAVDAEIGGSGIGQVHVRIKGVGKILINAADDLKNLPGRIRNNEAVKAAIMKAFEWLSKVKD